MADLKTNEPTPRAKADILADYEANLAADQEAWRAYSSACRSKDDTLARYLATQRERLALTRHALHEELESAMRGGKP